MKSKFMKIFTIFFIPLILFCFIFISCSEKNNEQQNNQISLPYHLYDSHAECIAYTNNNFLYDYVTHDALGIYDSERNIFINQYGHYFGEIVYNNVLVKNTQSEYKNIALGTQTTIPTPPTPRTAPTRATVPTLPSKYIDIF